MASWGAGAPGRSVFRALLAMAIMTLPLWPASAGDMHWPNQVSALYRLSFSGFDVGTYKFDAHFDTTSYTAEGKAKVSALFGAFKWTGNFSGSGALDPWGLHPSAFEMSYKIQKKPNSVKIGFAGSQVSTVALIPNKPPPPETIPVKPENLKNVFDPMAAMIAVSEANPANACNRTIPIFDGRQRYDLHFSLKGREAIAERHPSGQPRELLVCRVKYVPIAGHKPKDFVDPWIDYNNIEVALRAVPKVGVYVPYRVTISSPIGSAVMTADTVNITAADNEQIALKQ